MSPSAAEIVALIKERRARVAQAAADLAAAKEADPDYWIRGWLNGRTPIVFVDKLDEDTSNPVFSNRLILGGWTMSSVADPEPDAVVDAVVDGRC